MSEMIDRVEYAMVDAIKADGDVFSRYDGSGLMTLDGQFDIRKLARAAIEAMRDASFGMVGAGQIAVNLADDDESPMYLGRHEVEEIWEEMIDAALKD